MSAASPAPETGHAAAAGRGDTTLVAALVFIALVVAAIGSLGAPLITAVAKDYDVSLSTAQWTLTITLLTGAVATPLLGRLGSAHRRRKVVLATLAVVAVGSVATVVPAPFAVLLAGRAAQGVGLGLTALMMATARQHLGERAVSTIAMLSVASTIGIGVGYPIASLLTQLGGVRVAYLLGVVVAVAALVTAVLAIPRDTAAPSAAEPVDWFGAALLSAGLVAVLLVTSQSSWWSSNPLLVVLILLVGVVVLAGWVVVERKVTRPLVDLIALRHPAVAGANVVMFVSGTAMYLLFTLITRFVQTPSQVGYGYGLTEVEAGLVLVPFSALGFVAGRVVPKVREKVGPFGLLTANGVVIVLACVLFAGVRGLGVAWPVVVMGVLGFGVGGFSAVMPQAILAVTPAEETAAAMSVNQVVRSVGFSLGSAVSGLILAAHTPAGSFAPADSGYTTAAWTAGALAVVTIVLAIGINTARGKVSRS
ncbi:Predicted arabinose efflux permease, MFS family [Amycolatopsis tolypomycina]|uniref:Predicted arabinose efflux permease, MFS family n=1 Tax=Amycolatopsis tolypomycina TaxID=208445 RepID=A0A1H4VLP7_9PSEU|nr:MFS transporter [Amycolatopsis tolypomycina]SEC81770.1 Predicted arabinose efflux permease, MFS family [Amycolatopsis tolypomycina]